MQHLVLTALLCITHVAAGMPQAMLGTWKPLNHETTHAIIGPSALLNTFAMSQDPKTGDFWMSAIQGQVFRIRNGLMQYCFVGVATSPFFVNSTDANNAVFCYKKGERMRTHRAGATGCDAARITLELKSTGTLELTFMMSPPVKHAWNEFVRTGPPPPLSHYSGSGKCDPEHPGPPTAVTSLSGTSEPHISSMCPVVVKKSKQLALRTLEGSVGTTAGYNGWACRQLDAIAGRSWLPSDKVDVRLQHQQSTSSCWPCKVSYIISAAIPEDQYIAVGFKGLAYRAMIREERPNYFGMSTDEIDQQRTTGVIALGYVSGGSGCVREMKAENYVGKPTDVKGNPHLSGASVERMNGRTVLRFTVEQYAGRNARAINSFFNAEQVSMRVMWAIGSISGDGGCEADFEMHSRRGVSPLSWFNQNPTCKSDPAELGSNATTTDVEQQPLAIPRADVDATVMV